MNNETKLVSVVIPCYNLGKYLRDAIDSVLNQTYKNLEIIIVDDGSTDEKTVKLINEYKTKYKDVIFIIQKNMGLSEARNTGVRKSKGDYIVCLDADDKLSPTYVEELMKIFKKDTKKELGFVTTWLQEFGNRDGLWQTSEYNPGRLLVENIAHAGSMFRREAWQKVGGYKKIMKGGYEDWEFWISILGLGYKWEVITKPIFNYRIRDNSMFATATNIHLDLYNRIVNIHKDIYSKFSFELAKFSANRIQSLREEIKIKNNIITDYHKLQFEYEQLKSSRIVSPAIKLRNFHKKIKNFSSNKKIKI